VMAGRPPCTTTAGEAIRGQIGRCCLLRLSSRSGGGLRPAWLLCVSSLVFIPDWVDGAEADKVGSQESASARGLVLKK